MALGMFEATREKDYYGQRVSHSLRPLHEFNDDTVGDSLASKTGSEKAYSQARNEQPSMRYSPRGARKRTLESKTSSDYGGEWMDDLPSPSALLKSHKRNLHSQETEHTVSDYTLSDTEPEKSVIQSSNLSPNQLCQDSTAFIGGTDDGDVFQKDENDASPRGTFHRSCIGIYPITQNRPQKLSSLFLHTSSPEKANPCVEAPPDSLDMSESTSEAINSESCIEEPALKKRKIVGEHFDIQREVPTNTCSDFDDSSNVDVTTSSLPNGLEGIDPDLLAEFGDIVEFV
ncbi:hypothetical protein MMC14_001527 [Varicellaria rhodocarpa]|nr:hypothetical protein [Varicellaria rhodocarpa]